MLSALLVDATDLDRWGQRRDAQALLPRLLRRLIHATTQRGWDGIVAGQPSKSWPASG